MPIRTNTNPRPLELTPELQDILRRNGIQAHVVASGNGFGLMVQGHDSPLLQYVITEKQLKALTDWGTNSANRKAYNTFASIVAADFDMPKDFVHARNANGRVAMGLHGYRVGTGEYGRVAPHMPPHRHGPMPYMPIPHMMGYSFLGWTPRQQAGFHLRRIGGQLYYPGAPMVPDRPDGRMKPGELQSGAYGFYYKGHTTAPVAQGKDVLADLQTVLQATAQRERPVAPAIPYNQAITSEVYFSNEKWQKVLASHGLIVDADKKTLTVQSSAIQADLQYNLSDNDLHACVNESESRLSSTNKGRLKGIKYHIDGVECEIIKIGKSYFVKIDGYIRSLKDLRLPSLVACHFGAFDKFPTQKVNGSVQTKYDVPYYKYVGAHVNGNLISSSAIAFRLLFALNEKMDNRQRQNICSILDFIGYDHRISLPYSFVMKSNKGGVARAVISQRVEKDIEYSHLSRPVKKQINYIISIKLNHHRARRGMITTSTLIVTTFRVLLKNFNISIS